MDERVGDYLVILPQPVIESFTAESRGDALYLVTKKGEVTPLGILAVGPVVADKMREIVSAYDQLQRIRKEMATVSSNEIHLDYRIHSILSIINKEDNAKPSTR